VTSSATAAPPFAAIAEALADIRAGRMVVVVDDADRENEGDLTLAAEHTTPAAINFMARHGRGLICAALTEERLESLRIPLMTADNTSNFGTAFCESVDARVGVSTGISAADRALTIQALVAPPTRPEDLARPGGVLTRAGQTEAAVDLARLAGLQPAGVICEIMNDDGTMARVPELDRFCRQHGLKMITVAELIRYRLQNERYIHRAAEAAHQTAYGACRLVAYRNQLDQELHSALVFGAVGGDAPVLVRVQTHCLPAEWGSTECDCGANLHAALGQIQATGSGVLVLLHQNSPGYALNPDRGGIHHTLAAAEPAEIARHVQRQIGVGAQILTDLGIRRLRLLTNHPRRLAGLEGYGLSVVEHVPLAGSKG